MSKLVGKFMGMYKRKEEAERKAVYSVDKAFRNTNVITDLTKDARYNEPKGKPQVSREVIDRTIDETEIYRRAKEHILNAQREQVGYGLDKYPEPLNADTWTILETIDHSISEKVDDLHYTIMLRIKLEKMLNEK